MALHAAGTDRPASHRELRVAAAALGGDAWVEAMWRARDREAGRINDARLEAYELRRGDRGGRRHGN